MKSIAPHDRNHVLCHATVVRNTNLLKSRGISAPARKTPLLESMFNVCTVYVLNLATHNTSRRTAVVTQQMVEKFEKPEQLLGVSVSVGNGKNTRRGSRWGFSQVGWIKPEEDFVIHGTMR